MRQIYLENEKSSVDTSFVEATFDELVGEPVAEWYWVFGSIIDIQLGSAHKEEDSHVPSYDYSLGVDGAWEILDSGREVISGSDTPKNIDDFTKNHELGKVMSTAFFAEKLELFIEFTSGLTLHISPIQVDDYLGWVGLRKYNKFALHLKDMSSKTFEKIPVKK